jgi:hypothetical protein
MTIQRLAGAWKLQAFEFTDADGKLLYPLGIRPTGALVVTENGHAVISFAASERPKFIGDDIFSGSTEEFVSAAKGYVSFGGPCEVTEDTITIRVEYSLFPNWIGGLQIRRYKIDGDTLVLSTPGPRMFGGALRMGRAQLKRL